MAEFTYETRRKISENWVAQTKKNASGVPKSHTPHADAGNVKL